MIFDCNTLTAAELYPLLAGTIVPRPIAWVSTLNENGQSNLAPFSFFQLVCDAPPTLMLSVNRKAGGAQKDTARNIAATGQLVVHLVSPGDLALMNASAGDYAPDVSEIEALQIATVPALKVRPPRLAHSLVSFECECVSVSAYPAEAPACDLILAKVLCLHIDDSLLSSEGRIRHEQIDWLARLGGQWYCHSQHDDNLTLARPNQATPRR